MYVNPNSYLLMWPNAEESSERFARKFSRIGRLASKHNDDELITIVQPTPVSKARRLGFRQYEGMQRFRPAYGWQPEFETRSLRSSHATKLQESIAPKLTNHQR
jgi:hypothetical protein